jgi:hypothetical protein
MISEKTYAIWKPRIGILASITMLVVSIFFSQYGFSFSDTTGWGIWIGLALSLSITIIQLSGGIEENGKDWLMWIVWLGSYAYGIISNVKGISDFMAGSDSLYFRWMVAVSVGTMIEIAPERLLKLALVTNRKVFIKEEVTAQNKPVTSSKPSPLPYAPKPSDKTPLPLPSWRQKSQPTYQSKSNDERDMRD